MERNSFIFYKGWREAIKDLPDDVRLEIYESIIEYATTGNLRGLKPMANIAFNFIKIDIDRDTEKYMSIVERNKSNGSKGGRPKSENPKEPKEPTKPTGLFGFIWVVPISSELSFFALFGAPPLLPLLRFLSTMPWYLFSSISN